MSPQLVVELNAQQSYAAGVYLSMDPSMYSADRFSLRRFVDEPTVPSVGYITSLPGSEYTLLRSILVTVDYEEDYYIVSDDRFLRYAIGSTLAEARENYAHVLLDYYKDLCDAEERLAPHLAYDLQELRTIVGPREQR